MASDGTLRFDTTLDSSGFEKGSQKLKTAISHLNTSVQNFDEQVRAASAGAFQSIQQDAKLLEDLPIGEKIDEIKGRASDMREIFDAAVNSLAETDPELLDPTTLDAYQRGFEAVISEAERLESEIEKIGQTEIPTREYEDAEAAMKAAEKSLEDLKAKKAEMKESGIKWDDDSMKQINAEIETAEGNLRDAQNAVAEIVRTGRQFRLGEDSADFENAQNMLSQLRQNAEEMAQAFNAAAPEELQHTCQNAQREGCSAMNNIAEAAGWLATQALRAAGAVARIAGRGIIAGVRALGKAFVAVGNGIKNAVSRFRSFISGANSSGVSARNLIKHLTSLKTMLISKLKSTFINELMQGIRNGLNALLQYSSEFDASVSSMKNAMTGLTANISVSFANLINAVAPVITQIIDMLSTAVTCINAFFAMLSGKSVMTVAKKQTGSYAASLNDTAGSASKAADAQKELNEQIYGFDELNKRSKQSDSGAGSGSSPSGAGSSYEDLFEEVPIDYILPENIKDFFDKIKKAFEDGDWEGIGRIIADGLNEIVLAGDDWITQNSPKIIGWATKIADLLNGLVDGFNGYQLGSTVGKGLNTIHEAANTFFTRFNNYNLGAKIASVLNGLNDSVNWSLLGQTVANGLNSIIQTFAGFAHELQWGDIGTNIGKAIQSFHDNLDLSSAVTAVKDSIEGIALAVDNLHNEVDWKGNAEEFAKKFGELFDGESENSINWYELGRAISSGFNIAIETFSGWVSNQENWKNVGTSLGTAVIGLKENINWEEVKNSITGSINGLFASADAFIETLPWDEMGSGIWTFIEDTVNGINWDGEGGVADTITDGINAVVVSVTSFLREYNVSGTDEGINNFLWRAIDGIDWLGLGEGITYFVIDIIETIDLAINSVAKFLATGLGKLFDAVGWEKGAKSMYKIDEDLSTDFAERTKDTYDSLKTWVHEGISAYKEQALADLKASAGEIETEAENVGNSTAEGVRKGGGTVKDELDAIGEDAKNSVGSALTGIENSVSSTGNTISEKVRGTATDAQTAISDAVTGLSEDVYIASGDIRDTLSESSQKTYDDLTKKYSDIRETLASDIQQMIDDHSKGAEDIKKSVSDSLQATSGDMAVRMAEMQKTVSDGNENIKKTVDTTLAETESTVNSKTGSMQQKNKTAWENIVSDVNTKSGEAKNKASQNYASMESDLKTKSDNLKSTIKSAWEQTKTDVSTATENIKSDTSDKWDSIKTDLNTKSDDIKKKISDNWTEIENNSDDKTDSIKKKVLDAWESIKTDTAEKTDSMKSDTSSKFADMESDAETSFSNMQATVTDHAENTKTEALGKFEKLKSETGTTMGQMKSDVSTKMSDMETTVKNANWTSHGTNLISGFWNGLKQKWSELTSWFSTSLDGLNQAITSTFGIGSPSKLWTYFGEMLFKGFSNGEAKGGKGAIETIDNIARTINAKATKFSDITVSVDTKDADIDIPYKLYDPDNTELGLSIDETRFTGILDSVTERLESVTQAFYKLSEAFGDIAIPTVAYGSEAPYRARISDYTASEESVTVEKDYSVTESLDDQTFILKQIRNLLEKLHLTVDGEDIVRGVSSAQRGIQRAYGGV